MAKFIEVHYRGNLNKVLINVDWIEGVINKNFNAQILIAFQCKNGKDRELINTRESYEEVKRMIMEAGG